MPVFVFGQTDAYGWLKLGPPAVPQDLTERLARAIGFLPLFMYGRWGTPLPRKVCLPTNLSPLAEYKMETYAEWRALPASMEVYIFR